MECPFIDQNYPFCSENLSMNNLEDAFEYCTHYYMMCPIYIQRIQPEPSRQSPPALAKPCRKPQPV